jgi:hypothetical protein
MVLNKIQASLARQAKPQDKLTIQLIRYRMVKPHVRLIEAMTRRDFAVKR